MGDNEFRDKIVKLCALTHLPARGRAKRKEENATTIGDRIRKNRCRVCSQVQLAAASSTRPSHAYAAQKPR